MGGQVSGGGGGFATAISCPFWPNGNPGWGHLGCYMLITTTMVIVEDSSPVNTDKDDAEKDDGTTTMLAVVSSWGTSGHDQTTKLAPVFKFGIHPEYR